MAPPLQDGEDGEEVNSELDMEDANKFRVTAEELGLLLHYESKVVPYSADVCYTVTSVLRSGILKEGSEKSGFDAALQCLPRLFMEVDSASCSQLCQELSSLLSLRTSENNLNDQIKYCDYLAKVFLRRYDGESSTESHWRSLLTGNLVSTDNNILSAIMEFIVADCPDNDVQNRKFSSALALFRAMFRNNTTATLVAFRKRVDLKLLTELVQSLSPPKQEVIDSFFELLTVTRDDLSAVTVIAVAELCPLLIEILPFTDADLQRYICEKLRVMCATVHHNRIRCCSVNLIGTILKLLEDLPTNLSPNCVDCLISILEILGSLSISAQQLKKLIGLFRTKEDYKIVYSDRLVQALERMASKTCEHQPHYFFDFYDPLERCALACPSIHKWNGRGITFHTWICADFSVPFPTGHKKHGSSKTRHMLYSFLSSTGEGFEAFFTREGYLVIAVCTKREYLTSAITDVHFGDQEWHSLAIVHTRRQFTRSTVAVYIDSRQIHTASLKYPVTDDLIYSCIGYGVRFNPNFYYNLYPPPAPSKAKEERYPTVIAAGQQNHVWGDVATFMGQLSAICLFKESLMPLDIGTLYLAGPDNYQLLAAGPVQEYQQSSALLSLAAKLVVYYDAKAAVRRNCMDLATGAVTKSKASANLSARVCCTLNIKDAIQCIGGLQVLFPLLEQVKFVEKGGQSFTDAMIVSNVYDSNNEEEVATANSLSSSEEVRSLSKQNQVTTKADSQSISSSSEAQNSEEKAPLNDERGDSVNDGLAKVEENEVLDGVRDADQNKPVYREPSSGSFILVDTSAKSFQPSRKESESWTLVERSPTKSRKTTFCTWLKDGQTHTLNGSAHFVSLVRNMVSLESNAQDQLVESQGVEIMGHLLERCDPRLINIGFLSSIQCMMETLKWFSDEVRLLFYRHVLFNFQIWSFSDISVRKAHIQFLSTCIKDGIENREQGLFFKSHFGVDFIFHIIQSYYLTPTRVAKRENEVSLSEDERKNVRMALLGMMTFYLRMDCTRRDVECLTQYLALSSNGVYLREVMGTLKLLLESRSDGVLQIIKECANSSLSLILFRWLVHHIDEDIKIQITQVLFALLSSPNVSAASREKIRLKMSGFEAVTTLLSKQEVSRELLLHLLKLGLSTSLSKKKGIDVYAYYDIVLGCMTIVCNQPQPVKLEVARKIKDSVQASKSSAQLCCRCRGWYFPLLKLMVKDEAVSPREPDVMQIELAHTVIDTVHTIMWKGIDGSDMDSWKRRGEPLTALQKMSSECQFLLPAFAIERELLRYSVDTAGKALRSSIQPWAVDTQNAMQIIKIVEDFLLSSEFAHASADFEKQKWSKQLLDSIHNLVEATNAWEDSTEGGSEWTELVHSVERIYIACAMVEDEELVAYATAELHMILSRRAIHDYREACYEVNQLLQVYWKLKARGSEGHTLVLPVLRYAFMKFRDLRQQLPSLTLDSFFEQFPIYSKTKEFEQFESTIASAAEEFERMTFAQTPIIIGRFWMDALSWMSDSLKVRNDIEEAALQNFSISVYSLFDAKRSEAEESLALFEKNRKLTDKMISILWDTKKRFLTSERGAWADRNAPPVHWKLSPTENKSRMRIKLTQNYNFSPHHDARSDRHDIVSLTSKRQEVEITALKESTVDVHRDQDLHEEDGYPEFQNEQNQGDTSFHAEHMYEVSASRKDSTPAVVCQNCKLITLMGQVDGTIELRTTCLSFFEEKGDTEHAFGNDFQFSLEDLREVQLRRYNLEKKALEFFLVDRSSYFIAFNTRKDRDKFLKTIVAANPSNLRYSGIRSPANLLKVSGLTVKWIRRELSNFDYLMQLNTIAGRTYNDLSQYPIFPWVLADYKSEKLDLSDPKTFRDLSKPIGALTEEKRMDAMEKYKLLDGPGLDHLKCHHTTFYSNSFIVLHYLLRVEPFTSLHIFLQGDKYDVPDRQFRSVERTWEGLFSKGSDVKELIPEFFCFPEFLSNLNEFNFGPLRDGSKLNHVDLPKWASSPEDFITKHREALESDYVSSQLHHWIDLVFGYKQKGKAAIDALNVFNILCYEGAVNFESVRTHLKPEQIEGHIVNFGQVPSQLLTRPHPKRKTREEVAAMSDSMARVVDNLTQVAFTLLEMSKCNSPILMIGAAAYKQKYLLSHGLSDPLITVHEGGFVGMHGWWHSNEHIKAGRIRFELDLAFNLDEKARTVSWVIEPAISRIPIHKGRTATCLHLCSTKPMRSRGIPGHFSPHVVKSTELCALTKDGTYFICGGFADKSVKVLNLKEKVLHSLHQHKDVVTCVAMDPADQYFISGSLDSTCKVWEMKFQLYDDKTFKMVPIQTLYGHDDRIMSVAISSDLDLAVSCSLDGSCIIHTIRKGQYVRTLWPLVDAGLTTSPVIRHVRLSRYGKIVLNCQQKEENEISTSLMLYSINGDHLATHKVLEEVSAMITLDEYLITGSSNNAFAIRDINRFNTLLLSKNIKVPITSLCVSTDGSCIFIGRSDGTILVATPGNQTVGQ